MKNIIDCKKDESAVFKADRFLVIKRGRCRLRQSTVGWKLVITCKDGSVTWVPLKELKESSPVEVAKCARAKGIDDKAVSAW